MTNIKTVADVRREPPLKKGKLAGVPIQSHDDLISRLDKINSTDRGWTTNPDYIDLLPDMKERIQETAELTLLRSFLDFDNGQGWTQEMMPRSGRWKIAFPILHEDGRIFMRKVPINWVGSIEVENTELNFPHMLSRVRVPEFEPRLIEQTNIEVLDMLYVKPLTSAERDQKFDEDGKPDWVNLKVHREFGIDSLGNLVTFDPHG